MGTEAEVFTRYLLQERRQDLLHILQSEEPQAALPLNLAAFAAFDAAAATCLLRHAAALLPHLDAAIIAAQETVLAQQPPHARPQLAVKESVHARLEGLALFLADDGSGNAPSLSAVGAPHIGRLITILGTVVKAGMVRVLESRRLFECTRCKHRFVVAADLEIGAAVELPRACPSQREKPCQGTAFRHCDEVSLYTNYQEVKLQERIQCRQALGATPKSLTVLLQDELAGAAQVGDDVQVTGIVVRQFDKAVPGLRCHIGLALQATSLLQDRDRQAAAALALTPEVVAPFRAFWEAHACLPMRGRNKIVASLCPQLCGLFSVKLASLLLLVGGVAQHDEGGTHIRGELHMLLVGDPGTGKSQFMNYVAKLAPRSVVTSGRASSAAGLTAAAVREGSSWTLEAGALVLADGGVACIDEFGGIREADRVSMHEAMEQQTCSIAKAGMVTTLHTRTAVFGTCNPRGNNRFDPRRSLAEQLQISGPLLSRFDLVLLLLDDLDPGFDEALADHLLEQHSAGGGGASAGAQHWPLETLRQYIAWVKQAFHPTLSEEAEEVLSGYYSAVRQRPVHGTGQGTVRQLESLVRAAQAHARLMARGEVTLQDAVVAVWLMESSARGGFLGLEQPGAGLGGVGAARGVPGSFPEDPDADYLAVEEALASALAIASGRSLLEGPAGYLSY